MGWNGSDKTFERADFAFKRNQMKTQTRRKKCAVLYISTTVAAIVASLWIFFVNDKGSKTRESSVITAPKATKINKLKKELPIAHGKKASKKALANREMYLGKAVIRRQESTNYAGRNKIILTTEDGLTHRIYETGTPKIIFKHSSDNALAAMLNVPDGSEMAPFPIDPGIDESFMKSLKEEIVDNDDDTQEERRLKNLVRQARLDALELMKSGVSFSQILHEHQARAKENSEIRLKIVLEAKKIAEEDNIDAANEYVHKMNEALERMGIPIVKEIKSREK
jgi:hypothetical protein